MKEYLLGIDLGTSGTKTVLFRSDGTAMAAHTVEYPLYQPQNGWAEQEPSDWWRAVRETVQAVLHKSGVAAADVAGVGISGQMHGLVMLDERGEVLPQHPVVRRPHRRGVPRAHYRGYVLHPQARPHG